MIGRRRFLVGSAAVAGGLATAPAGWARSSYPGAAPWVSIGERFTPREWLEAFETTVAKTENAADRAFWRSFRTRTDGASALPADELHLLSIPAPGLEAFALEQARSLAVVSNDRLAETVKAANGAIGGLAAVSAFDPRAVDEAERAIARLGLAGLSLGANRGMRLSNPQLWPLYDFAQSVRAPIYLPAAYSAGAGDAPYRSLNREGVIEGAAADSRDHAAQLIFGGVLDAFPELTFVLGRLGEATPHWYRDLSLARAGMDASDVRTPRRDVSDYFRSNIYLTTADMSSAQTAEFCSLVLGEGRVIRSRDSTSFTSAEGASGAMSKVKLEALRHA